MDELVELIEAVDILRRTLKGGGEGFQQMLTIDFIRLLESPCPLVPPSPKNIVSYIANAYTMRTSFQMYDAVKMMMIIIIYVRCDHHHDDDHHHPCTMQSSSSMYDVMIIMMTIIIICVRCNHNHDNHHHPCSMQL